MQNSLDDNLGTVVDVPLGQTTDVPIQMPEERPFQSWNVEGDLRQSAFSVYSLRLPTERLREPPVPRHVIKVLVGSLDDYMAVWNNDTGFFLQTPNDGDIFYSFAMAAHISNAATPGNTALNNMDQDTTHSRRLFTGIFFCSHSSITISSLIGRNRIPPEWADNDLAMMFVPIEIMKRHAKDTAETLRSLIQRVMVIEEMVATNSTVLDFGSLTGELHELNTLVVKLQRRWRFETTLIDSICEFIDYYQEPVSSVNLNLVDSNFTAQGNMIFNIGPKSEEDSREERESRDKLINTKEFRTLRSTAILQRRLSRTSEYDLSVLPERIKNAFAAIFNLIVQRDSNHNIHISETMRIIAEGTLRDSSSMKTVAVMTMVFLPGTFICSFFSMTMFNWNAGPGERLASTYIWVYFIATVPITLLVMLIWWLVTKDRRNRNRNTLEEGNRTVRE